MTETEIGRPLDVVADYAADPAHAPEWYTKIRSVAWRTPPPLAVGSRLDFVAHFLGRRLTYTYEVVEYVPRRLLVMRTMQGPFAMETTYAWTSAGNGRTRMTLRNRGEPQGFTTVAAPALARAMRRASGKDLARLKTLLEGR